MMADLDYPLGEAAAQADALIRRGATVWQKWSCSHCGARQTMPDPNAFYLSGTCEECGQLTQIRECNYMTLMTNDPELQKRVVEAFAASMRSE